MRYVNLLLLPVLLLAGACGQKSQETVSPNGVIRVAVSVNEPDANGYGGMTFSVAYSNGEAIQTVFSDAGLGLRTEFRDFTGRMRLVSVSAPELIREEYAMLTGKRSHCTNAAHERTYRFENEQGQALDVFFRAYDDGVAFRYELQSDAPDTLTGEYTTYPVSPGVNRWFQAYDPVYEDFYPLATDGAWRGGRENHPGYWGYPALLEPHDSLFVLITEAGIRKEHSASRLFNGDRPDEYRVDPADAKTAISGSWTSPWRVLMIGSLADVVESTLVTDLSDPQQITAADWIEPGPAAWIYWAYNYGSNDFETVKEYIDLAADMGWPYHLIDWKWDLMENGGDVRDAIAYAKSKGVKTLLWYNSCTSWIGPGAPGPMYRLNDREARLKEYAWLREMGVSGIKIDFFAGDGAAMMDYYIDLLEDAVPYELMLNFHGATLPRGWQRTYPHLMTMESVYGAEWYNNTPVLTDRAAAHNATLPFTRNVVGSMDYTPGTFSDSQHPHITSHGHELALYVVFESAWQHMPDRPSSYRALPEAVQRFLSGLPTAWDDTRLLSGYPGREAVIARRKGDVWYIGGINGTEEARTLRFSLDALNVAGKTVTLYQDGADPDVFSIVEHIPAQNFADGMEVSCLPRGGFVAVIE